MPLSFKSHPNHHNSQSSYYYYCSPYILRFSPSYRRRRSPSDMFRSLFPPSDPQHQNQQHVSSPGEMPENTVFLRRSLTIFILIAALFFLYNCAGSLRVLSYSTSRPVISFAFPSYGSTVSPQVNEEYKLERVLKRAATKENTVIITTLNAAWAEPNSIIDLFLESFRIGQHTRGLLNHLVIVALDDRAFKRCLSLHPHCVTLVTDGVDFSKEAFFMTPDYLNMMWRRIEFLRGVLEMGYNFVFTDADIMWFRDPFSQFDPEADFQIACDHFSGDPFDVDNKPNGGFNFVRSNNRSIEFYKFWHSSREKYPGYHDQDVLNLIKHNPYISEIGLEMRFLDTAYFGGFCEPSKDLNEVCTMHANCCLGMDSKIYDLKILLQDWRLFMSLPPTLKRSHRYSWRVPKNCSLNAIHPVNTPKETEEPENAS